VKSGFVMSRTATYKNKQNLCCNSRARTRTHGTGEGMYSERFRRSWIFWARNGTLTSPESLRISNCFGQAPVVIHLAKRMQLCDYAKHSGQRRGARAAESGSLENCCRGNSTVGSNPTLSATPTANSADDSTQRGWDSNRGSEGDVSPSWGVYEGAGPLCRSVVANATSNAHPLRHTNSK
jgi:hypothetical protein